MQGRLFQQHAEDEQKVKAQDETRNRDANIRHNRGRHVQLGILAGRGEDPEGDADGERHEQGCAEQQDGVRQPLHEERRDPLIVDVGVAQVTVNQGAEIQNVLLGDGV